MNLWTWFDLFPSNSLVFLSMFPLNDFFNLNNLEGQMRNEFLNIWLENN